MPQPPVVPDIDLDAIHDLDGAKKAIAALLNIVQALVSENQALRAENQSLRDEIARLKGQPPRPSFPKPHPATPASSERERKQPKTRKRGPRRVRIDHELPLRVDPSLLPPDAVFKGYEDHLIQDLLVRSDNTLYRREKFYSPSLGKTFLAPLPAGCQGGFGPQLRAWVITLYFGSNTSQPNVLKFLRTAGVDISSGQVASLFTSEHKVVEPELDRAFCAALAHCPWQHLDDTGTRLDGVPYVCHLLTSPVATFFSTRPDKSRLTVLEVLRNERVGHFRLNAEALDWMADVGVSSSTLGLLVPHVSAERSWAEPEFARWTDKHLASLPRDERTKVWEVAALADYHAQTNVAVVKLLLTDDAPQFRGITEEHGLCWIHRGRNLKKLSLSVEMFRREQVSVLDGFWSLFRQLSHPGRTQALEQQKELAQGYDALVSRTVECEALGKQLSGMKEQREGLLGAYLRHPEVPLHNNPAELGARQRVRKRDVSFGPRTEAGARAWDVWQSVVETTRKLGVNLYEFVLDRLTGRGEIKPLAELIEAKAEELSLGWTWGLRSEPGG